MSFADREITSVHISKRDEDYETPPNSSSSKPENGEQSESEDEVIRFFGELPDSEREEDEAIVEKLFLRPKTSPSGGSTIGSATSDDENNFFGPVSSHFINPGRLSDTTNSEEHHDITMDSTAFSMHFRSLAMSESGELRTSMSSSYVPVEEKTPTQFTSRSGSSAMVLTYPKKLFPKSPLPLEKGSGGGDSNDMSLVGEDSRKYDYGHISPALAALLGDESKELVPASSPDNSVRELSLSPQNGVDSHMMSPYGSGIHPQTVMQESGRESVYFSCVTPSPKQNGSFMSKETLALVESLSTIQKSKSRLGLILPSPASALSQRIEKSKLQLSGRRYVTTPSTIGREEGAVVRRETRQDIPITNLEHLLSKDDNRTPVSEKKGILDQRSCGALSPVVDSGDVCVSPEGNISFEVEGSVLKEQERNQTVNTPEKFVSSLANSSDATMSALKNSVSLQDQEQDSKAISDSESGDGEVTKDCVSNHSLNTLSDKMDSLLAESCVLLSETGLNGSTQQNKEDSVLNENQNVTNSISAAHCATEAIPTEDCPALVTQDFPGTSGSLYVDRSKNEASHAKGPSRLKRKANDFDPAARNFSPKVMKSTQNISNPVMDHPDGNYNANYCSVVREQINWVEIPGKVSVEINQMLAPLANKLNSRQICKVEDIVTHLKKVHLCEMLCLQIISQKVCDDVSGLKTKRRAESRS